MQRFQTAEDAQAQKNAQVQKAQVQSGKTVQDSNNDEDEMQEFEIIDDLPLDKLQILPTTRLSDQEVRRQVEQQQQEKAPVPNKRINIEGVSKTLVEHLEDTDLKRVVAKRRDKEEKTKIVRQVEKEMKLKIPNHQKMELSESDDLTNLTNLFLRRNGVPIIGRDLTETKDFALNRLYMEIRTEYGLPEDKSLRDSKFRDKLQERTDKLQETSKHKSKYITRKQQAAKLEVEGFLKSLFKNIRQYKLSDMDLKYVVDELKKFD